MFSLNLNHPISIHSAEQRIVGAHRTQNAPEEDDASLGDEFSEEDQPPLEQWLRSTPVG